MWAQEEGITNVYGAGNVPNVKLNQHCEVLWAFLENIKHIIFSYNFSGEWVKKPGLWFMYIFFDKLVELFDIKVLVEFKRKMALQ